MKKIGILFLVVCSLCLFYLGHRLFQHTDVKSTPNIAYQYIQARNNKIFENTDEDKNYLLNLMNNSYRYFNTMSGSLHYTSQVTHSDLRINFSMDTTQNKSYQKITYMHLQSKQTPYPYDESIYDGKTYINFKNDDYIKAAHLSKDQQLTTSEMSHIYLQESDGQVHFIDTKSKIKDSKIQTNILPQDFIYSLVGSRLSKWTIIGNEKYLCRNSVIMETTLDANNSQKYQALKAILRIDASTGILLEAKLLDQNKQTQMSLSIMHLSINTSIPSELFEKHTK